MRQSKYSTQSGNVMVFILLGVILFGALIYTFMQSGQQGTSSMTKQQAKIITADVVNYARAVENAVNKVRQNGCSESQINIVNSVVTGISTPSAPGDGSCNIFDINGGKISWQSPPSGANSGGEWVITGTNTVDGVDTASADLTLILRDITQEICDQLIDTFNVTTIGNDATIDFTYFTGTFANTQTLNFTAGKISGCQYHDNSGTIEPFFYHVLLQR